MHYWRKYDNGDYLKGNDMVCLIICVTYNGKSNIFSLISSMNVFKGETCSGKTTLINSIIGEDVLPTDFMAATKHVCRMKYSDTLAVITRYNSGQEENESFPVEEGTAQLKEFLKERVKSSSTTISCVDVLIPSSKLKARTIK